MKKVAVSLHAKDNFSIDILKNLKGLDYIHIDVMDGKFINNLNLNLDVFKLVKKNIKVPIIAHLMVVNPLDYLNLISNYIYAFFFHFEIHDDIKYIIESVKEKGKKVGLVINPKTEVSDIVDYLPLLDFVLILGVNPGWSGQKFIPNTINKVNELEKYKKFYDFLIDVDGGINLENAILLEKADILTSASTILNSRAPNKIIKKFKEIK